jgi:hypothetical protein
LGVADAGRDHSDVAPQSRNDLESDEVTRFASFIQLGESANVRIACPTRTDKGDEHITRGNRLRDVVAELDTWWNIVHVHEDRRAWEQLSKGRSESAGPTSDIVASVA